jgi:LysR family transcriptional regulator, carnitine catabolism transcriptional activator
MTTATLHQQVTLKQFRAFAGVAETASFTRAAERLFLTQSTLTTTIRELESTLGVKLFDRSTREVTLTREGADFYPVVQRLLQDVEAALADIREVAVGRKGHVRIAAGMTIVTTLLTPVIAQFSQRFPAIKVHIRDDNGSGISRRVKSLEADIGISGKFGDDPELIFHPQFRDRFGVVCRCDHALAKKRGRITWRDLDGHRYIESSNDTTVYAMLQRVAGEHRFFSNASFEASSLTSLECLMSEGLGFTVISALAASHNPRGDLVYRELHEPKLEREVCIITKRGRALSPSASAMLEMLKASFASVRLTEGVSRIKAKAIT